jgi:uncharacterized protein (TIGR03437 family)
MKHALPVVVLSLSAMVHVEGAFAQPSIAAVVNGASYSAALAPGCWAVIFGTGLAQSPATAPSVPLPTTLGGVSVTVAGVAAPLAYVSPTQVNILIPFEVPLPAFGAETAVVVSSGGVPSNSYGIPLNRDAPAIFTLNAQGTGSAIVLNPSFQLVNRVAPADYIILYAAGLGPTDPPVASASGASSGGPLSYVVDQLEVYVGEQQLSPSAILFAGLAPGFPGVYQLNLQVPAGLATDRISIREGGWQSNVVQAGIAAGQNVANVTGSILGLYPYSPPPAGFQPLFALTASVTLQAAAFKVSFQILPSAQPFTVAAVGEAGSAIISIDPAKGTFTGLSTVPTAATRTGDFYQTEFSTIFDWNSCDPVTALCTPFPANIIPASLLDPSQVEVEYSLPLPNTAVPGSSTGLFQSSGSAIPGSTVTIDGTDASSSNYSAGAFGAWLELPYGPFATHESTLTLFVDGQSIASTTVTYPLLHR